MAEEPRQSRPEPLPLHLGRRVQRGWAIASLGGVLAGIAIGTQAALYGLDAGPGVLAGLLAGWVATLCLAPWRAMAELEKSRDGVMRLTAAIKRVTNGHSEERLDSLLVDTSDEIGKLSHAIVDLARACISERRESATVRRTMADRIRKETTKATARLAREVETDPLTGLGNRRQLERAMDDLFAGHSRRRGDQVIALAIDLDKFKLVNDTLGHEVGDDCIRYVGQVLRSTIRTGDSAIRLGGDEFLLLLPDTSIDQALQAASRIRHLYASMPWSHDAAPAPTLSIGVAAIKSDATDPDELLRRADRALYKAKDGGRDRVASIAA